MADPATINVSTPDRRGTAKVDTGTKDGRTYKTGKVGNFHT